MHVFTISIISKNLKFYTTREPMGKYQFEFGNVDRRNISNIVFDCRTHNNLNFYDRVSSLGDIGQNWGANWIWRVMKCALFMFSYIM